MSWIEGALCAFDLETTGVDVDTARIVTAAAIVVGQRGVIHRSTWLADPGIDIPDEAAAIHGITTEHARKHGAPARDVVERIASTLNVAWGNDGSGEPPIPVVAVNAAYDLTVLARELERHGLPPLDVGPVLDPLVIDRAADPYRPGSRKLVDLAGHYGVRLDGAHAADADALAGARVLWRQARITARSAPHPNGGRTRRIDYTPLRDLGLDQLQRWQAEAHRAWAEHYQQYLRTKANPPVPDAAIDGSWPLKPVGSLR